MQEAFAIVLLAVVGIGAVIAVVTLVTGRGLYRQIGRGGLSMDGEQRGPERPARASPSPRAGTHEAHERDEEIRQMLRARNARRRRRGEPELEVEAELARITAPAPALDADPAIEEEVRQLVIARNRRRVRAGKPPLDVEAETRRQLRDAGA